MPEYLIFPTRFAYVLLYIYFIRPSSETLYRIKVRRGNLTGREKPPSPFEGLQGNIKWFFTGETSGFFASFVCVCVFFARLFARRVYGFDLFRACRRIDDLYRTRVTSALRGYDLCSGLFWIRYARKKCVLFQWNSSFSDFLLRQSAFVISVIKIL